MAYDQNERKEDPIYSKRLRAGKRRTYFFDVRSTRGNDFFLTITESRKRFEDNSYDRHKIFLYKEDFNKFLKGLTEAIDYVKTELMPDFDFDAFNHDEYTEDGQAVDGTNPALNLADASRPIQEEGLLESTQANGSVPSADAEDKW